MMLMSIIHGGAANNNAISRINDLCHSPIIW